MPIGLLASAIGGIFGGSAARKRQRALNKLAERAEQGIDLGAATGESLGIYEQYIPKATDIGTAFNEYYAREYDRLRDLAYPGYSAQRQQYSDLASSLLAGGSAQSALESLRRAATGNISGGTSGSMFGSNRAINLNYNQQMANQMSGANLLAQSGNIFGQPQIYDVSSLAGLTPAQVAQYRQGDLDNYLKYKAMAVSAPGATDVAAQYLSGIGGTLMGAGLQKGTGLTGILSGGGSSLFGGGGSANAASTPLPNYGSYLPTYSYTPISSPTPSYTSAGYGDYLRQFYYGG